MKKVLFIALPIYLLLASCSGDKDKPDAYGTFEATEVTVSSQTNGKILFLKVEEGQLLDSNVVVGIVDTLDMDLKKSQAREQQLATSARRDDLAAQIAVPANDLRMRYVPSANLTDELERLADFSENQQALISKIKSAMYYPIVMLFMGTAVIFLLMTFVVP